MAEKKQNQTEGEFFALVATGRKGVEDMLAKMGGEIHSIAAKNVQQSFDTWTQRALVEISNRDELRPVLQSREGIFSVYKALAKASQIGIQIGGQFPQAYLVPYQGRASLIVTAEGYAFAAVHGPGAVLCSVPELVEVYDKDSVLIDKAAGTIRHTFDAFKDRGKLVGYYMRLEYRDGHVEAATITREEVEKIEAAYSSKNSPAFSKSAEAMHRKTAAKQLLKKPVREAEGLAMLLATDEEPVDEAPVPPPRDVGERMTRRLDDAAARIVPSEEPEPVNEAPAPAAEPADEKALF